MVKRSLYVCARPTSSESTSAQTGTSRKDLINVLTAEEDIARDLNPHVSEDDLSHYSPTSPWPGEVPSRVSR